MAESRCCFKQCGSRHVRRDLKLDNTLLDGSLPPRVKLCDFGFAKAFEKDADSRMFTIVGCCPLTTETHLQRQAAIIPKQRCKSYDLNLHGVDLQYLLQCAVLEQHVASKEGALLICLQSS